MKLPTGHPGDKNQASICIITSSYHEGLKQQAEINLRRDWYEAVGSRRGHEGNKNHSGQGVTGGRR